MKHLTGTPEFVIQKNALEVPKMSSLEQYVSMVLLIEYHKGHSFFCTTKMSEGENGVHIIIV